MRHWAQHFSEFHDADDSLLCMKGFKPLVKKKKKKPTGGRFLYFPP